MTGVDEFNTLPEHDAMQALLSCCSATRWAAAVAAARPYTNLADLLATSDAAVAQLTESDLHAALAGHPRIGDRRIVAGVSSSDVSQPGDGNSAADGMPAVHGVAQAAGTAGVPPAAAHVVQPVKWSGQEQAGVRGADELVLRGLAEGNGAYELRFGHIYLACATGRSAQELLDFLNQRLGNDRPAEWRVVAGELARINQIRLRKLIGDAA
jgi:2-oxo-4-hydroxy-4-carboxy-5-ureidoimidazoline decarboxylase